MNDWISLLLMMLSAAEMALFSERMLFSALSLSRLCACALLLVLLRLMPLPLCLLMTPLIFVLAQLLSGRLMLSEILFPCMLYGLILNIQAVLPFQALSSVVLLFPLLLMTSRLQKLYEIFRQEKAAALLLTLISYIQLLGASLLTLHDAFDLQLFLLVLCVMFTICADTLLLPLLHTVFLSAQEERRLARLYETYEKQLQRRMRGKSDGQQLRRMRHDIINLIQTIATAKERKEDAHEE